MARLSEYDFELCKEICEKVANGSNIKSVLKSQDNYPSFQTWCTWKRTHSELLDLYTCSLQDKSESEDEEIDDVIKKLKAGEIDAITARVIIDTKKWKAAKYYPKMFGDKVDVTSGGDKLKTNAPITIQIDGNNLELE